MSNEIAFPVALTPTEWHLVRSLRELPESTLKARLQGIVNDLCNFVAEPRCTQTQADGVPCASASADCESCQRVTGVLAEIARRLSVRN
jgi:hypothetical protein